MKKLFKNIIGISEDINKQSENTQNAMFGLFITALIILLSVFTFSVFIQPSTWGPYGDFIGGLLNPLLTFLTFIGLLITIILQQTELKEARKEFSRSANALDNQNTYIQKQIFESTFFQMLSLHNSIVNSLAYKKKTQKRKNVEDIGRSCFNHLYTDFSEIYKNKKNKKAAPYTGDELKTIRQAYKSFWDENNRILGHYYRYLYNLIRFIDESSTEKITYIRLVRSQLSDQELLCLFYNSLTENGKKFKPLIEKYKLLDNMNKKHLLAPNHKDFFASTAYGE
ncbi:MAG: hypothetical protein CMH30_07670 [Micavibrio sp.]|nr:hypothetical protein [Micavibrio sp.]